MQIEVFQHFGEEENYRLERRVYELPDGLERVLVSPKQYGFIGDTKEVWGFDSGGRQHNGVLLSVDKNLVLIAKG